MVMEMFKSLDNQLAVVLENPVSNVVQELKNDLSLGRPYVWFYDNTNTSYMYLAVYENSTPILGGYTIDVYNNNNSKITVDGYQIRTVRTYRIAPTGLAIIQVNSNQLLYVPAVAYNYFGDSVLQSLRNLGLISADASLSDLRSGLSSINQSVISEGDQTQNAIRNMSSQVQQQQQLTTDAVEQGAQQTTNSINEMSNTIDNRLQQQQNQSQANYDQFTNSTYYDNSVTVIDPSEFVGDVQDTENTQGFLTELYNKVYNKFLYPNRSTRVVIPMPHNMDDIVLDSSAIVDFYNNYSAIGDLITIFWYFIIGRWVFAFVRRIYLFFVTGAFADTSLLSEYLSMHNEIIKTYMM